MQRKEFLKYAYMRRAILEDAVEREGKGLEADKLNAEYQALDLLLMAHKKEVEEIEKENSIHILNTFDYEPNYSYEDLSKSPAAEKKVQKRKRVFRRRKPRAGEDGYIYKDLEKAVNKECYKCGSMHEVYYYREHDLFLCAKCEEVV